MHYEAALKKLYSISPVGVRLGLDRIRDAASLLGNPQEDLFCVQIAGSNGKGQVAKLVCSAATRAGLKTGLFTSPHLHRFTERYQICDVETENDTLLPHLQSVLNLDRGGGGPQLTFFEVATLAAFSLFREEEVDLAVLEVGLGGRLDATSIATPAVTAITSICLDHTEYLGNTLAKIAFEKASIARADVPMVISELPFEATAKVLEVTSKVGAPLHALGTDFQTNSMQRPKSPGKHQEKNAAVAGKIIELLRDRFHELTPDIFARTVGSTVWPGRFEILDGKPRIILDGAHNLEAAQALVDTLEGCSTKPDAVIFGTLKNKPHLKMLDLLRPRVGRVVLIAPPISRALNPTDYACSSDQIAGTPAEAMALAGRGVPPEGTILVTGSLFTVAAIRAHLLGEKSDPPIGL